MYSRSFTVIFHLLVTMLLINCVTSEDREVSSVDDATTDVSHRFVATTPSIVVRSSER